MQMPIVFIQWNFHLALVDKPILNIPRNQCHFSSWIHR